MIKTEISNLMRIFSLICVLIILSCTFALATGVHDIRILKISNEDQRAVVKMPDGKMQIIKAGDVIADGSKVVEITAGRVVLEEKTGNETETVIIRLEDGKQRVERIKKAAEKQPQLYATKPPKEQKERRNEPVKKKNEKGKKDKSK